MNQFTSLATVKHTRRRRTTATFFLALAIIASATSAQSAFSRSPNRQTPKSNKQIVNKSVIQIALFPALLPRLYSFLSNQFGAPGLAELLSSPLLLLLPPSWRAQAVLYAASTAMYHSVRKSRWSRHLPPIWTLNILGNAWLLWAFLFRSKAFPVTYEKVILSYSTYYVPPEMPKRELEELLQRATFAKQRNEDTDSKSEHTYELCAKLHPTEPSCLRNYLKAWLHESLRTSRWVGALSALPILLIKQRRRMEPLTVLKLWLESTLRGTAFIAGSINTSWALLCLLQRILPRSSMKQSRWLINASISSLWILVLPQKRRSEIALYVSRLAVLCAWKAWRLDGGIGIPFGDVLLFALSWIQLTRISRQGENISGLVGLALSNVQGGASGS